MKQKNSDSSRKARSVLNRFIGKFTDLKLMVKANLMLLNGYKYRKGRVKGVVGFDGPKRGVSSWSTGYWLLEVLMKRRLEVEATDFGAAPSGESAGLAEQLAQMAEHTHASWELAVAHKNTGTSGDTREYRN